MIFEGTEAIVKDSVQRLAAVRLPRMRGPGRGIRILPMNDETAIRVILYGSDLMFRSRINAEARAAGQRMTSAASPPQLLEKLESADRPLVLVDMDMADAREAIRLARDASPDASIVAYYAHVRDDLREAVGDAGANATMPRSRFVTSLPEMLAGMTE